MDVPRGLDDAAAALAGDDVADRTAGQLLARYGVVFREIVARESFAVAVESDARRRRRGVARARGLVRGGRFVAGFGLASSTRRPKRVDAVRRTRRQERAGERLTLAAVDPLNLVGILAPGPRVPAHLGASVLVEDGARSAPAPASSPRRTALHRAPPT